MATIERSIRGFTYDILSLSVDPPNANKDDDSDVTKLTDIEDLTDTDLEDFYDGD